MNVFVIVCICLNQNFFKFEYINYPYSSNSRVYVSVVLYYDIRCSKKSAPKNGSGIKRNLSRKIIPHFAEQILPRD